MFEYMTPEELADQGQRWEVRAALALERVGEVERRIAALSAERSQLAREVLRCQTTAVEFRNAQEKVPTS